MNGHKMWQNRQPKLMLLRILMETVFIRFIAVVPNKPKKLETPLKMVMVILPLGTASSLSLLAHKMHWLRVIS